MRVIVVALVAGGLFGALTSVTGNIWWMSPLNATFDSAWCWAWAPFAWGFVLRRRRLVAAASAGLMMATAAATYYGFDDLVFSWDPDAYRGSAMFWVPFSAATGLVFGFLGRWCRLIRRAWVRLIFVIPLVAWGYWNAAQGARFDRSIGTNSLSLASHIVALTIVTLVGVAAATMTIRKARHV